MAAFEAFGGERKALRVHDGEGGHTDVLRCNDTPYDGWACYSTLTLHELPNLVNGNDIRIEIAGMCGTEIEGFAEALADAGQAMKSDKWVAAPEILFADIFKGRMPETAVPHMLLCPPYPWDDLARLELADGTSVHWLLAFPISEAERQLFLRDGFDALEARFTAEETEYFDMYRSSIV